MTLLVGVANFCGGLVGTYTVTKFGRKVNMLYGVIGCFIGMLSLSIGILTSSSLLSAFAVLLYMLTFAIGMGCVMPMYCSEVIPAVGMGIAYALNWFGATLVGKAVPILVTTIGAQSLIWIFIILNAVIICYIQSTCPET